MDKQSLVKQLVTKKAKDYMFIIIFFFIFSFFIIFAIRPNLNTVFFLQSELKRLTVLNQEYDDVITEIVNIQTKYEVMRDDLPLLDEAVPEGVKFAKVMENLTTAATNSGIIIQKVDVVDIPFRDPSLKKGLKKFQINIETDSDFVSARKFVYNFMDQRRLKIVNNMVITRNVSQDLNASDSANLKIKMEVEDYFL
ncbi:MAG: hypothetical protein WCO06_00450 [Candidatus Roizmanbacteria bacterium]